MQTPTPRLDPDAAEQLERAMQQLGALKRDSELKALLAELSQRTREAERLRALLAAARPYVRDEELCACVDAELAAPPHADDAIRLAARG